MRSSFRKRKPWIIALIVVIVAIMILPLYDVINVLGQIGEQNESPVFDPDAYMEEIRARINYLESFLEENEPTTAVLKELSSSYMNLLYFADEEEDGEFYSKRALELMEEAVEIDPENAENYLTLYDLYNYSGEYEKAVETASKGERIVLDMLAEDPGDNISRFKYSRFLTRYRYDFDAAVEQLTMIMESEEEDSHLYNDAKIEKERLIAQQEAQAEAALKAEQEAEEAREKAKDESSEIEVIIGDEDE